jgi:hypothetical protein
MFKQGSVEDEIYRSMETTLVKNQVENRHGFNKLAKAADLLSTAAEIFDKANMFQESDEIAEILKNLSKDVNDQ